MKPTTAVSGAAARNVYWHPSTLADDARAHQFGHAPLTLWLTGLSGAGKSTLAYALEKRLYEAHRHCAVLDGDNLRHHLNHDLGFTEADRTENLRRAAEVARLMNDVGLIVITAFISPLRSDREMAREIIGADRFVEVHVCTALDVCEARDPKGLYARARGGLIPQFTGVSAPYELPAAPSLRLDTGALPLAAATAALCAHLASWLDIRTLETTR
ncbi:putative adenylyl-sulfate kinase [Ralstonia flaminis]|uniref:Adenylyl-sulfate kinase n=1 Tax=Ralstonia flaminis TaxID=3058597 RepID=A0ABN9JJ07_9RALS|nr:adenylyl-sulfate kinase [Ralstonia sp. LMG 18101]CAJ0813879.1 putative adenylyl-sulfate kinase [Ralstonia sp. LMG 18101]